MNANIIKTETDYQAALACLETLMDAQPGSAEFDELELLTLLVEKYEDEYYPIPLPDPIEAIKFRMEQQGLSAKDMAAYLGSPSRVSEVLNRKRPLSLSMIRALNQGLGIPAEVLLGPSAPAEFEPSLSIPAVSLSKYFNCFHLAQEQQNHLIQEWQAKVEQIAMQEELPSFERKNLNKDCLRQVVELSQYASGPQLAGQLLKRKGIHLIILKLSTQTDLDGACFYTPHNNPIISLTLRHDRLDDFWYILLHQLAHLILNKTEKPVAFFDSIDCMLDSAAPAQEKAVSDYLKEILVPSRVWKDKILQYLITQNKPLLEKAAQSLDISPEIIALRARLENQDDIYTQLFTPRKVSDKLEVYA